MPSSFASRGDSRIDMPDPPQERSGRRPPRHITPLLRDTAPLIMLASALFYSNRWFTLTDDEASAVRGAAQGVGTILAASRSAGNAQPFLYEMLLHFWLRITGGAFDGLRAPAIVFFFICLFLFSLVVVALVLTFAYAFLGTGLLGRALCGLLELPPGDWLRRTLSSFF
jgi:hypothetical protein